MFSHFGSSQIFLECSLDVNSQDVGGWSALHEAAFAGREDFIERLLSFAADINIQNSDGATPLFTAAQYGHKTCLKLLLKEGADIGLLTVDKASPLFIASQEGLTDCINMLLTAGRHSVYFQSKSNCSPTPPLTQQQSIDDKLGLMLG